MIKEINGFPGYFVSDTGYVFCNLGKGNRDKTKTVSEPYILKGRPCGKRKYLRVYLRDPTTNKRKDYYIHRLVAAAFIPNPDNKPCVNHINCNTQDNSVTNLEWVTTAENNMHTFKVGHIVRDATTGRLVSPE